MYSINFCHLPHLFLFFQIYSPKNEKSVLIRYPTKAEVPNIIRLHHSTEHSGINQTTEIIQAKYRWKGMHNDIRNYTKQPKVFQQPEFTRKPFKASIILVESHNYIIQCLKKSSNVIRAAYHVISGHVLSIHLKWHMCLHHVPLVAQVAQ